MYINIGAVFLFMVAQASVILKQHILVYVILNGKRCLTECGLHGVVLNGKGCLTECGLHGVVLDGKVCLTEWST